MLRFSRLFKPNKSNQLPNVWKNVKVKRKKPEHSVTKNDSSDNGESKICLEFAPAPDPELVASDDEVFSYIIIKCCRFFYLTIL